MNNNAKLMIVELERAFAALSSLAPEQADFIDFSKNLLKKETEKEPRISRLKRIEKEFMVYVKNVLSKKKFEEFEGMILEAAKKKWTLDNLLVVGEIRSAEEFRMALDALDAFIQERVEFSESDANKIAAVNKILAAYEKR